jgi:hypothetical protein
MYHFWYIQERRIDEEGAIARSPSTVLPIRYRKRAGALDGFVKKRG